MGRFHGFVFCMSVLALAAAPVVVGQTFVSDDLFVIATNGSVADIHNITAGGDFSAATPFATLPDYEDYHGEMCFSPDLSTMYVAGYGASAVHAVTAAGVVSTHATGVTNPTEIECLPDGTILVQEFSTGRVVDVTAGGDFTGAAGFITHTDDMRGLTLTSGGDLLVVGRMEGEVRNGTTGGALSTLPLLATLPATPAQSVNEGLNGAVLVGTGWSGGDVYDVQTGTPALFAYGLHFLNTATCSEAGAVYASEIYSDDVFDITAGGDFSAASSFASGFEALSSAIAAVPPKPAEIFSSGFETGDLTEWEP